MCWHHIFIFFHPNLTKLSYDLCPDSKKSWCKYKKTIANGESYDHNAHFHLPGTVCDVQKPIFRDQSSSELLRRCLNGGIQNWNESFNDDLWAKIPKRTFVSINTPKAWCIRSDHIFPRRKSGKMQDFSELEITPDHFCVQFCKEKDIRRMKKRRKYPKKQGSRDHERLEDHWEEQEGKNPFYAPGAH
ncbi:hypothetical protein HHI36_003270 [Cryptolaemus montrouzieri]|uniref:Uncharacterized protein n=1 Tax=Cryptolaemus montrouzieri TaxID=559131 RepID=A0ABD2PDP7_9CUCU